jgi:3-oxoacyl-[acyl-carrier protein] reductase
LSGTSVIVTGAGQGLGRAFALFFAREGYTVTACDLNAVSVAAVVDEIEANGGEAIAVVADISVESDCRGVAERALERFGEIGVLINNAGIRTQERLPFWEVDPALWDRFMAVNIKGTWLMMRAVLPAMRERGGGSIINISSATFLEVPAFQAPYITSKAAIIGLTRAAARELGNQNIRVNAILPSSLATEVPKNVSDPEGAARRIALKALPRQQVPDDLLGTALFLASDASKFMTGQSLNVDGGQNFL